ncbi:hypothetical protein HK100_000102, partial [Physocladia obscura]
MNPKSLLPQHIRNILLDQSESVPSILKIPRAVKENFGLAAIIDISGYSKLSSDLEAKLGSASGAKIKELINPPMEKIIASVHKFGGSVIKFAGDAVIRTMEGFVNIPENEHRKLLCINALLCCLELLDAFKTYAISVPEIHIQQSLKIHIGLGTGEIAHIHIGSRPSLWSGLKLSKFNGLDRRSSTKPNQGRVEYFVAGKALAESGDCLGLGISGDLVFGSEFNRLVQTELQKNINRIPTSDKLNTSYFVIRDSDSLHEYQIKALEIITKSNHSILKLESNLSVPQKRDALASSMEVIVSTTQVHGGCLRQFNCGTNDKALTALLIWGLEGQAHEKGEYNLAVSAACQIASKLRSIVNENFAIGVTSGTVFSGIVGNSARCDATVLGVVVNNAARLMSLDLCKGVILCDLDTYRNTVLEFEYESNFPEVILKGVPDPVKIFSPSGPKKKKIIENAVVLCGREEEKETLLKLLIKWRTPPDNEERKNAILQACLTQWGTAAISTSVKSNAVVIVGQSGIGKTQIIKWLEQQIEEAELICRGVAQEHKKDHHLFVWGQILKDLLNQVLSNQWFFLRLGKFHRKSTSGMMQTDPTPRKFSQASNMSTSLSGTALSKICSILNIDETNARGLSLLLGTETAGHMCLSISSLSLVMARIFNGFTDSGIRISLVVDNIQ